MAMTLVLFGCPTSGDDDDSVSDDDTTADDDASDDDAGDDDVADDDAADDDAADDDAADDDTGDDDVAGTGDVEITALHTGDGTPLQGAEVTIEQQECTTAGDGICTITGLDEGLHAVTMVSGYCPDPVNDTVTVIAGEVVQITLYSGCL